MREYWLTCKVGHLKEEEINALEDAISLIAMKMNIDLDIKKMYMGVDLATKSQEKPSI
ncbi:MAG: hypothetical protein RBT15_04725 [Gudongella sp.]|jgi:hypothetical protein|nr:hypothetical protein [Gudongella sp.]